MVDSTQSPASGAAVQSAAFVRSATPVTEPVSVPTPTALSGGVFLILLIGCVAVLRRSNGGRRFLR